jgi:glycosyltransferase involved in cell wall biosynthesis
MPEAPSLAVIIPAYNAERFLERAVESVFATGYPWVEVAIVDDGSTDGTLAVARNLERRWAGRCKVLRHPNSAQMGVSASRNLGIESTTTDWISFLDADDEYLPHRFDDFLSALDRAEVFDAIYGMAEVRYEEDGLVPAPNAPDRFGIRENLSGPELLTCLLEGRTWATSAITLRRSALGHAGNYDITRRIAEDCHLWFRLVACARVISGNLDRPVSVYWRHGANTYTYKLAHRLPLLNAMLDAWDWMRIQEGRPGSVLDSVFETGVTRYAINSLVAAREAVSRDAFIATLSMLLKRKPSLLANPSIARIALRALLGRWRGVQNRVGPVKGR